jgi:pentatricopeptide repeat protein
MLATFNALVAAFARDNRWEDLEDIVKDMQDKGVVFNEVSYSSVFHAYGDTAGLQDKVAELYDKSGSASNMLSKTLARVYSKCNMLDEVEAA